uniref:Chromodomain helicase DNA binding protein 7 n=1 Tax=Salmo trutta TaxID=8032 RepID=A0A674E9X6_SALTR
MADPGILSLFGDDANLFSDGLEGLGDCGFPQDQPNPIGQQEHQGYGSLSSNSLNHPSQAGPGQPKMGHPYDPFAGYEQQQGNGPAVNGMVTPHSRYHNNPQQPGGGHHVYPRAQGDGHGQSFPDGGAVWSGQGRPPFQQQQASAQAPSHQQHDPSGPQDHGHRIGPYMGRSDYATMQGHPGQTQTPPRINHFPPGMGQEPNHYMGHVGLQQNSSMTGHPAQQQQFLHRPGQGPVHTQDHMASHTSHQQHQGLAGRPHQNMGFNMHGQAASPGAVTSSGPYPPYPQYANLNQGLAGSAGMSLGMSLSSTSNNNSSATPHQQPHLPTTPHGSYGSPTSMKGMGTTAVTPPPQQVRPPSAGLAPEVGGYPGAPLQAPNPMAPPQRNTTPLGVQQPQHHPQHLSHPQQHPHMPPSQQLYPGMSPNQRGPLDQVRPPGPMAHVYYSFPFSWQYSTSSEMTASDRTPASGVNLQPANRDKKPTEQKPKKKKAKVIVEEETVEGGKKPKKKKGGCIEECGEEGKQKVGDGPWAEVNCLTGALEESLVVKTKKKPKEPKEPKTPKTPKTPKEPKEKAKSTTPKAKMPKKPSSYLHCRWANLEELEKDKRIHQKVKRFRAKQALPTFVTEMDDEPFNPDYVEVDRVLDVSESTDENGEPVKLYLVKWCSLPYEDITWELKTDIDQAKIDEYEAVAARQPETKLVERPPTENWQKSQSSRDYKNDNALREYQLEGVNWLLFNWYNTRNCILADEMGLGKTIQSITFLYEIYLKGIHGPFLVIAPLSTIPNWEREFRTWTELNVIVYHGSQASRKTIQAYEMNYRDVQGRVIKGAYKFHAVITTFEMILTDCPELRSVPWRCVVIDEAHRLKNRNCKLLEGLKMMDMEHKVLLTGTPLQNTVEELFSLLNFLEPERFPSENIFMQEFGDLKTEEQVQKLQAILKPMMLRRLKEDVEKNLAPKEETIIEVELTNIQKKYYRAILEKNFSFLSKGGPGGGGGAWGGGGAQVPNLLNTMMELRKCCNHPYLINGAEEKILEDFRENHHAEMPQFHLQAMIQAAGKLVLIDKLLPKLKAGGHRVLVFSQMVRCLDILEDYLIQKRYPYERIDGRVRGNLRQAAIDRFSRPDSDRFVFLLCTRAGGLGINLTAADTCIIFDSDWNPQNDLQAQARCHRIGQSKAVKIYRLITRNSYEREMFDKASLKLGLDKAVLQSMSGRENAANGVPQLSKKEVEDLLRKGAYGALMDEEDEGSKFCEEDIDQILLRRTQTITIESEGKGSTFAKASFVAAGNRTDISLEDPDFWQKWAKKAELDMEAINGRNTLVIDTPRVRKQTRHYSSMKEDELAEFSELESDGENEKPLTKPRRPQDRAHGYPRSECFRVEKNLLVYGWGRWGDILSRGRFKRPLQEQDVETICRALLAYCLLHYRGDENIKRFIWDLITPSEDGQSRTLTNHSGLSTPVPRGRKGKKGKPALPAPPQLPRAEWLVSCNPDLLLQEDSYKRHLKHHCNKVLLRVRMLYYLRQEVIGDHADRILEGTDSSEMDIWIPQPFHSEVPADWWDSEADRSLLIGVFKHGYEKYNSMRADPALCFLERVGMPDAKAIAAEQRGADMMADGPEGEDEDPEYKPLRMTFKDEMEDFANSPLDDKEETVVIESGECNRGVGRLYWPAASALTARLRRLITAYQRTHKREQLRQEAMARPDGRRRRRPREHLFSMVTDGRGAYVWTRREESDFYRVVSTFGVIYDTDRQRFDWTQFRAFARLDKKSDESLEKYYFSFVAMCKRVCRMQVKTNTELPDPTLIIDPITEERASRTLYRIELLRRIREQVLPNPLLGERLRLCQPSSDLPEWWDCGRHDLDLLLGASKHGVSRTDYHILNDPALGFLEAHRKFTKGGSAGVPQPPHKEEKMEVNGDADGETSKEAKPEKEYKAPTEETNDQDKKLEFQEKPESPKASEEQGTKKEERDVKEGSPAKSPKPVAEKGPDEEKMEEDDNSEKSSQAEAGATSEQKNFDEESNASLSTTARDETRDGFCPEDGEPSAIPALQERTTSSFWPKDRVMINRMDNICDVVIMGKWPANRRQLFDFPGLLPGYPGPMTSESPMPRRSLAELSMAAAAQTSFSGSEDLTLSPQVNEDALSISLPKQRRRRRRKVEIEAERVAKRRNLMDMVAQLRESHAAESQSQAMDLTKSSAPSPASSCSSMVSPAALKAQMELLQASTPSRHRANCSLVEADLPTRRRRGRRKNVEGLELLFMRGHKKSYFSQIWCTNVTKASVEGMPPRSHRHNIPSTSARVPSVSAMEDREAGTPSNKDLSDWLRQHPTYTMDMPTAYTPKSEETLLSSQFPKPKQKRHRCRNPNKIDINTLTGEERVPVVNRRNGRKMGGAMAPPMKDLPRWLLENPDFAVAPEWTDIVKQSGFLPEAMFDRLLTGPLVREEGVRRRGRRPKSEIAKATAAQAASSGGLNPLLINGLFGGMDLTSLQGLQSLQSLQLQLMGFPGMGGADAKHVSAMLPLVLPGMGGLPNMFGLGGLFASNLAVATPVAATPAAASNGTNDEGDSDETSKRDAREGGEEQDEEKDDTGKETESSKANGEAAALNVAAAAMAASGMSANSLAFNPFLLSTMAPGLFSPYMFLPPGLGGLTLPGFPPTALADLQVALDSPAAATADPETADDSDSAESLEKTAESSALEDEASALAEEADSPEDLEAEEEEEGEDALEEEEKSD